MRFLVSTLSIVFLLLALIPTVLFTTFLGNILSVLPRTPPLGISTNYTLIMSSEPEWRKALDDLPATPNNIPAFFFGHGSPLLAFPESEVHSGTYGTMAKHQGPTGSLARFLRIFGPTLLEKYKPKGIVVFSAHWETARERLGEILPFRAMCTIYGVY